MVLICRGRCGKQMFRYQLSEYNLTLVHINSMLECLCFHVLYCAMCHYFGCNWKQAFHPLFQMHRAQFTAVKEDLMLLAVGVIGASAFLLHTEGWSQVRAPCWLRQYPCWNPHRL